MDSSFWKNKRVFITGHTGFKGSWLTLWLCRLGAKVTGYSLPPNTEPSLFEKANIKANIHKSVDGDIRDLATLQDAVQKADPEIIFHLAAQPLVQASYLDPVGTFQTNVIGTAHLLECARKAAAVRSVIVVTSDKCYDTVGAHEYFSENDMLGGLDPYSSSKASAELVTQAYFHSFWKSGSASVGVSTVRSGNCIGGGDWAKNRIIPDFVHAAEKGKPLKVRNPLAIRPWQHVLDPLAGYLLLAERSCDDPLKFSGPWNFGPANRKTHSVQSVVEFFVEHWPYHVTWELDSDSHPKEVLELKVDSTKAKTILGWEPRWNTHDSLLKTLDWYSSYFQDPDSAEELSRRQIDEFLRT